MEPGIALEGRFAEPRIALEGRFAELRIAREVRFAEPCIVRESCCAKQRWAGKVKAGKIGYTLELVTGEVRGRGFVLGPRCIVLLIRLRILDPVPGFFQLAPFGQPLLGPGIPGNAALAEQRQAFFFVHGNLLLFIRGTDYGAESEIAVTGSNSVNI